LQVARCNACGEIGARELGVTACHRRLLDQRG
jgi:hypothetical protein